jgi:tetratricopeptide (TPR) repeat protein
MTAPRPLALLALLAAACGVACTVGSEVPSAASQPPSPKAREAAQWATAARAASSAGNFAEAAKAYEDYLAALAKDADRDPADYANGLTQLAGCYYRLKFFARAATTYREAVACESGRLGPDHEDVLGLWSILASVELRQGNAPEAERILRKLLATEYRLHARGRREAATLLTNLAEALEAQGQDREATQCRQEAKDIRHKLCDEC